MSISKENITRAHDTAKMLYLSDQNITQKEIALRVGVSEQTISRWLRGEEWEQLRSIQQHTKDRELRRMYSQLSELNTAIEKRPAGQRYPSSREADTQRKLSASIRQLEYRSGIKDIVQVSTDMINYYRSAGDMATAKTLTTLCDAYLSAKLKDAQND